MPTNKLFNNYCNFISLDNDNSLICLLAKNHQGKHLMSNYYPPKDEATFIKPNLEEKRVTMPNCIFVPTPKTAIAAILATMDIKDKTIYEPGCGNGDFLKACLLAGARSVIGSEPNGDLECHKMNKLANAVIYNQKHEDIPIYSLKGIDYVYCYLMHGMMEPIIDSLTTHNSKFTVISLNYPIPFWRDKLINLEPCIRMQHEKDSYPPYALIYKYNVNEGNLENHISYFKK